MITAKRLLYILACLTFTFAQNTISLSHEGGDDWSVGFNSDVEIGGFQFTVDGATIDNSMGGSAEYNGFMVSASANTVLGFSLTGSTIPAGSGVLLNLTLDGEPTGLSNIVFSDANGSSVDFEYVESTQPDAYYVVDLETTGTTQLTILSESISGLAVGDEIGIFDENAITNYNDCSNEIGELLVGSGVWDGNQLNIVSVGSQDLCAFGGVQVSGYVEGNSVVVKVWRASEQMEYATSLLWDMGSGNFGDVIQSISEVELLDPNACVDDNDALAAFGGCASAVAVLGCDFVFGGVLISESCPETCDNCPDVPVFGCMDESACNYNPDANTDSGCEYAENNYDCDGNCIIEIDCAGNCGILVEEDECGECGGNNSTCSDCAGTPNGDAVEDNCGTCDSDASNDCTQDCAGVWGGVAFENECGCVGGSTQNGEDYCYGCTDSTANNYDHDATIDDGSCDYSEPVDGYTLSISGYENGQLAVNLANEGEIGGFQFTISSSLNDFVLNGASGGSAEDNGFMMSSSPNGTIVGFSLTGGTIPAGNATLLFADVSFNGENGSIWVDDIVLATPNGDSLAADSGDSFNIGDGDVVGCMDDDACNYNPDANQEGECEYAEPNHDCDGNYLGNELTFGEANFDNGTLDIILSNTALVGGFQFSLSGLNILEAGGGTAEENGFMLSASGSTVIGFSLTGGSIPIGEGVLLTIHFDSPGQEICFSNPVFSSPAGDALDIETGDCIYGVDPIFGCMDDDACNYNPDANQEGECEYAEPNHDCDGNYLGNELTFGEANFDNGTLDIILSNTALVGGFQFSLSGLNILEAGGGTAEENGFMLSASGSTVIGFSLTGGSIPIGEGVLLTIHFDSPGQEICFSNPVFSSPAGDALDIETGDCIYGVEPSYGCMDPDACNYDPDATAEGDCNYPEDNYDCNGECIAGFDCAGECGGDAYWMSFCQDTDGDGLGNPGTEVEECVSGGRDIESGCDLPLHTITLNSNGDVLYNTSANIGGFQFSVNGGSINSAAGGDAEAAGFMISSSGSTVLGFSMTGASFGPCGTMLNLNTEGEVNGLSEIVISSSNGSSIEFEYFDGNNGGGDGDLVADCSDEYPNCAANYYDCNEDCGGSAEVDECGDCGGDGGNIECWDGSMVCDADGCTSEPENIFFSEYIEGSTTNKALEIFNGTGHTVNLDGYEIWKGANGGDWNSGDNENPLSLSGNSIENGDVFVVCRSSVPVLDECDIIVDANQHPMNFNGDDAIALAYEGVLLDVIGQVGVDPGQGWDIGDTPNATRDHTLIRNLSVDSGSDNWNESASEWAIYDIDTFDYLGSHSEILAEGCQDSEACNYNADADIPCADCCEYAEENFDCEGNCVAEVDCAGECGGDAYWMSFCEDTDGDGLGDPATEIEECVSGGREISDGCDLPLNSVSLLNNGNVLYNSSENIGGFQFSVNGGQIISAAGGDAEAAGFMISASGTTVLGFSMTGASFGPCGTVLNLNTDGDVSGLTDLVFSSSNGEPLPIEYYDIPEDEVDVVADCSDEYPDCAANYYDCNEECGGSADVDECGDCGGAGASFECWNGELVCDASQCEDEPSNTFYNVELEETGQSQLTLFSADITTLSSGDEIGIFDSNGITNYNDCSNQTGELLVGAGVWNDGQLNVVSIGSIDMCPFGGVQLSGYVEGNPVVVKVYKAAEEREYETTLTWSVGTGNFGDVIQSVDSIELIDDTAIEGCIDPEACNYNPEATVPSDCDYAVENFDCDGNCIAEIDCAGECGGDAVIDECGDCGGGGIAEGACDCDGNMPVQYCEDIDGDGLGGGESIESCEAPSGWVADCSDVCDDLAGFDCAGECGGNAIEDECGVCEGGGIPDDVCDCDGNLPLDYCYDADGDGLGAGDPFNSCFAPEGWVNDCSDTDPDCATDDTDDCGVCGGDDSCFGCTDSAALNYSEDAYIDDDSCEYAPNYPFWSVHAPEFQYNGSITSAVMLDDLMVGNEMDMVAVFVNGEIRGVENGLYFAPTGNYTFNVLAYSNETAGEILSFKYYDAENDAIVELNESLEFVSDMIIGNAMNPFILTPQIDEVTTNIQLVPGWNWFSVNAVGDDMSLNTVLGSVNGSLNYIKSQTSYSEYYDSYGWWGTLESINNAEMYKSTAVSGSVIEFTAAPVNPADVQIGLSAGWNWVGYTPQNALNINTALNSINGVATYIKDQTTYSEYYDSYGWWGTLENMNPYGGYMISTNSEGTLVYPDNMVAFDDDQSNVDFDVLEKTMGLEKVDASMFEFNGSVTASIDAKLETSISEGDVLYAYVDGELRGKVDAVQSPISEGYLFPIMLHSNVEAGELINFKLMTADSECIEFNDGVEFNNDMMVGNALTPFLLSSVNYGIATQIEVNHAYPNPFNPNTSIDFTLAVDTELNVSVYDMNGRMIETLVNGTMEAGHNQIVWNASHETSGVYFIKFESSELTLTEKVVLIK